MESLNRIWKAFVAVTVISAILIMACSGTRDDSLFLDEEAFPSDESSPDVLADQPIEDSDLQADEAEVLRLLGITQEEKSAAPTEKASIGTPIDQPSPLRGEITELEKQVVEKDRQLKSLRAELDANANRIESLEKQLRQASTSTRTPSVQRAAGASSDFEISYHEALSLYNNRDYRAAIREFERLLSMDATNSLSDNCQYWIGECYFGLGQFNEAIIEFEKVFNHANSNKYDDAQLKLGLCYMRLGDSAKAKAEFERLLTNYPDSEYAQKADQYRSQL